MAAYDDIPQINALKQENDLVDNAIKMIDGGGTMASFVITPPPMPPEGGTGVFMMASSVSTAGSPPSVDTMLTVRAWLVQRSTDINAELVALGVTDPPPVPEPEPPPELLSRLNPKE